MRASLKRLRRERIRQGLYHTFYSARQSALGGTVVYRRFDGREVVVSEVMQHPAQASNWPDAKYLGAVPADGFVRRLTKGSLGMTEPVLLESILERRSGHYFWGGFYSPSLLLVSIT